MQWVEANDVTTGSYVRGQHFFWIRDLSKTGGNSGIKTWQLVRS